MKSGEDPAFSANKENIGLNFDTEKDDAVERKPSQTSDTKEFKFAQPKQPVGCRGLPKSSSSSLSSRSLSDPSPQVRSFFAAFGLLWFAYRHLPDRWMSCHACQYFEPLFWNYSTVTVINLKGPLKY